MTDIDKQLEKVKGKGKAKAPAKPKAQPKPKPKAAPKPKKETAEYETMRIVPLRRYAKKLGVKRWNTRTRSGLITAIKAKERQK
jgi:hypothetical protein